MTKKLPKIPPEKYSKYADHHDVDSSNEHDDPVEKSQGNISIRVYGIMIVSCLLLLGWFLATS